MVYDVIIAGAGPVGLFLASELRLAKLSVPVLEQFDYSNIDSSRWPYRLPGPADTQLGSEMEHLERILAAHALSVGVEIRRGHVGRGHRSRRCDPTDNRAHSKRSSAT